MISAVKADVRRFALHVTLGSLAWGLSNAFSAVFLLHTGLAPAQVFLVSACVLALRFVMRPLVLVVAPRIGIRRTLILGAMIIALSYPALALVDGAGIGLLAFVIASSLRHGLSFFHFSPFFFFLRL